MKRGNKGNSRFNLLHATSEIEKLKDDDLMPDKGQHYNKTKMANIPPKDLIWLYENKKCSPKVRMYIKDNLLDLRGGVEK